MADEKTKKQFNKYSLYDQGKSKNKSCPRCGPGVFMAAHPDRASCGKCGYSETQAKPEQKEQPKAEAPEAPVEVKEEKEDVKEETKEEAPEVKPEEKPEAKEEPTTEEPKPEQ